jgi:hypothetical protein
MTTIEVIHTDPKYGWKLVHDAARPWAVVEMKAGGHVTFTHRRFEGQRAANAFARKMRQGGTQILSAMLSFAR